MIFTLSDERNKERMLSSIENMIRATYKDFSIDKKVFNLPASEILISDVGGDTIDFSNDEDLFPIIKNYLKTISLQDPSYYEEDTIEKELAVVKDIVERQRFLGLVSNFDSWKNLYERIFE